MAEDNISNGAGSAVGLEVGETAGVEVGLLEVKVELLTLVTSSRVKVGENFGLQSICEGVVKLDLGSEEVGCVP